MPTPTEQIRKELEQALDQEQSLIGKVYRLQREGLDAQQIRAELGYQSAGTIHDHIAVLRSLLLGEVRTDSRAKKTMSIAAELATLHDDLSDDTARYLAELERSLGRGGQAAGQPARPSVNRRRSQHAEPGLLELAASTSLRLQVDEVIRDRVRQLSGSIRAATEIEPDDYHAVVGGDFALDALVRLIAQETSRTTRALWSTGRLDLSIETAVVGWAEDLPLHTELVDAARGRLTYWQSQ